MILFFHMIMKSSKGKIRATESEDEVSENESNMEEL